MTVLFINGSPHKNGSTVALAKAMLDERAYGELDLVDYKVYGYGQEFDDDQFGEVLDSMDDADTIVIGSPVYWHNLSGMVRNLLDRLHGALDHRRFNGKRLAFLYQGAAPDPWMIEAGEYPHQDVLYALWVDVSRYGNEYPRGSTFGGSGCERCRRAFRYFE